MRGEGRIHTKGKKVGHCRVSQRLLSMIEAVKNHMMKDGISIKMTTNRSFHKRFFHVQYYRSIMVYAISMEKSEPRNGLT